MRSAAENFTEKSISLKEDDIERNGKAETDALPAGHKRVKDRAV